MLNINETILDHASNAKRWATNLGSAQLKVVMVVKVIQVSVVEEVVVIDPEVQESVSNAVTLATCQENVQLLTNNTWKTTLDLEVVEELQEYASSVV